MEYCVYQYSTEDAYCKKLLLVYLKICCYSYPLYLWLSKITFSCRNLSDLTIMLVWLIDMLLTCTRFF